MPGRLIAILLSIVLPLTAECPVSAQGCPECVPSPLGNSCARGRRPVRGSVGGGAIEADGAFQQWFVDEVHRGMPPQREEQADIPIHTMPDGDCAGARGAAMDALALARTMSLV